MDSAKKDRVESVESVKDAQLPKQGEKTCFTFKKVELFKKEALGTGSYGAVCKAKCDQLICAAKLLHPVFFHVEVCEQNGGDNQLFEQECQFLSRINHPNIVQYLGTYRDPETNAPVLLMELMDESLTHFLKSSPGDISYHIQVNISQDIAQALHFLHANGIIHRDLSSNNVLLIAGSRAKVSDFGMSKFIDSTSLTKMTRCRGTQAFMSPEALNDPLICTEKVDNFSLGVLIIQIIVRKFPKPSNSHESENIPNPRDPSQMIKARIPVPEAERRQIHISQIEKCHPLLLVALSCLKDNPDERPFSQEICKALETLKKARKYCDSYSVANSQQKEQDKMERALHECNDTIRKQAEDFKEEKDTLQCKIALLQETIKERKTEIRELKESTSTESTDSQDECPQQEATAETQDPACTIS